MLHMAQFLQVFHIEYPRSGFEDVYNNNHLI